VARSDGRDVEGAAFPLEKRGTRLAKIGLALWRQRLPPSGFDDRQTYRKCLNGKTVVGSEGTSTHAVASPNPRAR